MFKILVVLVVGAFIVSQAKPYHQQYLEQRIHKREAEKAKINLEEHEKADGHDINKDGDDSVPNKKDKEPEADAVKEEKKTPDGDGNDAKDNLDQKVDTKSNVDGDDPSADKIKEEPEADAIKEEKVEVEVDTKNPKYKRNGDELVEKEAKKDGDDNGGGTKKKEKEPEADAVKEEEENADGDTSNTVDKTLKNGDEKSDKSNKDGDGPLSNVDTSEAKPKSEAVRVEELQEEEKSNGGDAKTKIKAQKDGHEKSDKNSNKHKDSPASEKKVPEADAVKKEETADGDTQNLEDNVEKDGHDKVDQQSSEDGDDVPRIEKTDVEPETDAVKEEKPDGDDPKSAKSKREKNGDDKNEEQSLKDGDDPLPETDAVKEEKVDGDDPKISNVEPEQNGDDKYHKESLNDGDDPLPDSIKKDPKSDAVKEEKEKADIVPEADAVREELKDKDASGSIEQAFVKEAKAEIDGDDGNNVPKSNEMLRRKRRDTSEVLKKHDRAPAGEKSTDDKNTGQDEPQQAEKAPEAEAVMEAQEGDAQANPAEPVKESGAGQNAQAAAPIKEAPTKEEATVAKVADSVAEQELSKKVAAIEGEVNKALDDQQSQQVAVV